MKEIKLDKEELLILRSFENEEFKSNLSEERRLFLSQVAAEISAINKVININLSVQ